MSQIHLSQTELTVGELAERSGTSVSALHFYERKGLIYSRRTSGNQRRYSRDNLRRVAFIRASQRLGIPLSTIREGLDLLPGGRTPTQRDWVLLARAWRRELDARIEEMNRMRNTLAGCIGCGCLSMEHCRLANPDDALGAEGSGPRRLFPDGMELQVCRTADGRVSGAESPEEEAILDECDPVACVPEPSAN